MSSFYIHVVWNYGQLYCIYGKAVESLNKSEIHLIHVVNKQTN